MKVGRHTQPFAQGREVTKGTIARNFEVTALPGAEDASWSRSGPASKYEQSHGVFPNPLSTIRVVMQEKGERPMGCECGVASRRTRPINTLLFTVVTAVGLKCSLTCC